MQSNKLKNDYPLVTFALFCYNQENFIRAAVEGALYQEYKNLEIIISDDCSTDRTYQIIQDCINVYNGPHKILLNTNYSNLGIIKHLNIINKMSRGELIVAAAGDDISDVNRVNEIVDVYLRSNRSINYIYSLVQAIDLDSRPLKIINSPGAKNAKSLILTGLSRFPIAIGASQAWSKKLIQSFPPLHEKIYAEDQILGFRGLLMGDVFEINKPLVKYRIGSGVSTVRHRFNIFRYYKNRVLFLRAIKQKINDAIYYKKIGHAIIIGIYYYFILLIFPVIPIYTIFEIFLTKIILKKNKLS